MNKQSSMITGAVISFIGTLLIIYGYIERSSLRGAIGRLGDSSPGLIELIIGVLLLFVGIIVLIVGANKKENENIPLGFYKDAFKGIAEVFYDPASLFKKIKEKHTILIPYMVLLGVSLMYGYLIKDLIMEMQLNSPEFQEQMNGQELPESAKSFMEIMSVVGMGIGMILTPLATAGLALFFGNFVMGGKAKFKTIFSMMIYCEVLYIIGNFVLIPMVLAKGDLTTGISLGFLVADQGVQSVAFTALSKISLFQIWTFIVAGIGLSIIYDFSRNKGYMLSVLSVGLLSIMHIGAAALGAMFK